ncbi:MAG TPA: sigma 54-interacting transcriptional regulator [Myxococcales bacterium]|nr:sigma 54-interacting transcriptional regulator [Myxococcales bacterium]
MNAPLLEGLFTSENEAMQAVLEHAARAGERPETPIRIVGEVGAGKEVLARFIHVRTPVRGTGPFVRVACAGIGGEVLESELFGRDGGALGALEQASGGTLFLEDVGELPARLQLEFLRILKTHRFRRLGGGADLPFDARIVIATSVDLAKAARQGLFRPELFHRLDVVRLLLPPLRQRREDVLPLARWFLLQLSRQWARAPQELSEEAERKLLAYDYPGNVRELRNMMESAVIATPDGRIDAASLPLAIFASPDDVFFAIHLAAGEPAPTMAEVEKRYLERVLRFARGNRSEVARVLGLSYPTVTRKIAEYGLKVPG